MKQTALFTTSGTAYWHFHPIGTGIIFTYHVDSMQVMTTCEYTGQLIETKDFYAEGGLSKEEFKKSTKEIYKEMLEDGFTINLDYLDDPEIVGVIGVDFELLLN